MITCHLTTSRASRNRFSTIIFHDYLHYCEIFLARFLITVVLNIISSLHIVFSLCARVGWCDVCTDFTNVIKVDVNNMSLLNISHAQYSTTLHVVRIIIFLSGMCLFCWQKCGPRPKLFLRLDIFSTFRGVHALIFIYVLYIFIGLHEEPANFNREKRSVAFVTNRFLLF